MNDEVKIKLADLRAEWAKAPFMTKQMAGAYMAPMLDLLEAMQARDEALSATLLELQQSRVKSQAMLAEVIAKGEELAALPGWLIDLVKAAEVANG